MKILLAAESWDATTGPYESLYPYMRSIFVDMGHEVQVVDNKKNYLPLGGRTMWEYPERGRRVLSSLNNRIVNRRLRRAAREWQPDLILFLKCENVTNDTVEWLRRNTNAILFNWDHDNPFKPENTSMDLLKAIPSYDAFGVWGRFLIPSLHSIGCKRVEYLPMFHNAARFTCDPVPSEEAQRFTSQIAFIGIGSPERARMLRHLLDYDLAIWGNWDFLPADDPLRKRVRGERLSGKEYCAALRSTRIAVNVLNVQNSSASNTRTFEAPGMGAFLLTEYTREQAAELFVEGKEIACFRSPEELRDKVRHYLSHDAEREQIARAGRERVLREHTLAHRLKRICEVAEEVRSVRRNG